MKNLYKIITFLFVSVVLVSCQRDQGDTDYLNDRETTISFAGTSGNLVVQENLDNIYKLVIKATQLVKNDLSYSLTIDPSSTAVEGVDYTFIGNSTSFNNGSIVADVRISGNFDAASTEGKTVIFKLSSPDAEVGVNDVFSLSLFKFCPFNRDDFLGSWDADEEGYAVYPVTITAGAADNEILISNVWDADPNSSTRVFLIDESETLGFPPYTENYLYDNSTYGPAYIDRGEGTFSICAKTIDMYFQVRVAAGFFGQTHITFTKN